MGRSHCRFTLRRKSLLTPGDQISCPLLYSVCSLTQHLLHHTHPIVEGGGEEKKKQRIVGFNTALAQLRVKSLEMSHLVCEQHTRNKKNMREVPQNKAWRVNTCPLESSPPVSSLPPPTQTDADEGVFLVQVLGVLGLVLVRCLGTLRRCTSCFFFHSKDVWYQR